MSIPRVIRAATSIGLVGLALAGCQSLQTSESFLGVITPYRVEVVQGNVVTSEQVALAKPGLTRAQVRDVLGSPLLADPFHADRWDYIYRYTRQDKLVESREFRVYFVDNKLARWEGDEVPRSAAELNRIAAERSLGQPPADDRSWWDKFIGIFHRND